MENNLKHINKFDIKTDSRKNRKICEQPPAYEAINWLEFVRVSLFVCMCE